MHNCIFRKDHFLYHLVVFALSLGKQEFLAKTTIKDLTSHSHLPSCKKSEKNTFFEKDRNVIKNFRCHIFFL